MLAQPTQRVRSGDSPPVTTEVELTGLGNRFLGLLGRRWSRRSFATEVAKLLAQTTRVRAVAVLGYERQRDRLVLLADYGLSTEARLMLGGAVDTTWDIPLRGLRSRRISVVEAAHQNPLIPQSLRGLGAGGLCVVSLPLYYAAAPVGAVVLFAARSRAFSDAQLQTISQALRVCGRGLCECEPAPVRVSDAAQGGVGGQAQERHEIAAAPAEVPEPGTTADAASAVSAQLRLVEREPAGVDGGERAGTGSGEALRVVPALAGVQAEMQHHNAALRNLMHASRAIRRERDRLRQQLAELETLRAREAAELRGQLGALEDRLLAVESERQRTHRLADAQRCAADEALEALGSERDTLRARLEALAASAADTGSRLAALGAERDALAGDLRAARAEQEQARQHYAQTREAFAAEREDWHAQRARHADEVTQLQAQVHELTAAHAALAAQLDSATAEVDRLHLAAGDLRQELCERQAAVAESDAVVRSLQAQLAVHAAEQQSLLDDLAQLRADQAAGDQSWAAAAAREAALTEELVQLRAQLEPLRLTAADRGALEERLAGLRGTVTELEGTVAALQEQVATGRAEATGAAEHAAALLVALEAERRSHGEALAAAAREQQQLQEAIASLQHECQRLASEREQAREAFRQADGRSNAVDREVEEVREHLRQRDAALAAAAVECERLQRGQSAAEATAAAAAAEIAELRGAVEEAVRRLEQERLDRAAELEALLEEAAPESALGAATDDPARALSCEPSGDALVEAPVDDALTIERSAPLAPLADVGPEVTEPLSPSVLPARTGPLGELVVLDDGALADQACAALAAAGFEVTAQPLGEATVDELARRKLKCVMLNLGAGAAAWRTLRMLRERASTRNVPVLAYVMGGQVSTGFCLGRVDFALWPLEPGRLIEQLGRLRPKLQRLLIVSADVEGMGALREPLGRAKISSSIVLDAKQALEFASMVEPDAAVVHLGPACPSSARAIAGLRANEPTRDLPILLLLDTASLADDEGFFISAGRHLLGRSGFQFSRLPEEIGRLIG